jgi:hypothetical protein
MRHALFVLLAMAASACNKPKVVADRPADLNPVDMGNHPTVTPLPDPDLQGGHVGRAPRRVTVAQLKNSILITTGRQWSQIDTLSASLGKADFALVNAEAAEPNLVFAKFLEDGAREVCLGTASTDLGKTNATDRILSPMVSATQSDLTMLTDAEVRANMVYLSTRFWGQPLTGDELETWVGSFKLLAAATKTAMAPDTVPAPKQQAWGGICIAMMTDSRFFTY